MDRPKRRKLRPTKKPSKRNEPPKTDWNEGCHREKEEVQEHLLYNQHGENWWKLIRKKCEEIEHVPTTQDCCKSIATIAEVMDDTEKAKSLEDKIYRWVRRSDGPLRRVEEEGNPTKEMNERYVLQLHSEYLSNGEPSPEKWADWVELHDVDGKQVLKAGRDFRGGEIIAILVGDIVWKSTNILGNMVDAYFDDEYLPGLEETVDVPFTEEEKNTWFNCRNVEGYAAKKYCDRSLPPKFMGMQFLNPREEIAKGEESFEKEHEKCNVIIKEDSSVIALKDVAKGQPFYPSYWLLDGDKFCRGSEGKRKDPEVEGWYGNGKHYRQPPERTFEHVTKGVTFLDSDAEQEE